LELVVDAEEDDLDFWELDERLRFSNFFFPSHPMRCPRRLPSQVRRLTVILPLPHRHHTRSSVFGGMFALSIKRKPRIELHI
jgi:hypothetical protein